MIPAVVKATLVPPGELAETVAGRGRTGQDRLVAQVPLDVGRKAVGRFVAPRAVLFQGLHHDPVQIAAEQLPELLHLGLAMVGDCACRVAQRAHPRARLGRLLLADDPQQLVVGRLVDPLLVERRRARQQLVQEHAQRVDVAAGVDVQAAHLRLLGAHVERRAHHVGKAGVDRPLGQPLVDRLGHAEVDDLGDRHPVVERDQHVGGLDVAVDNPLLMGMLHRMANRDEQFQTLLRREVVLVAVVGDGDAADQLHDEVGPASRGQGVGVRG